jgi:hypothetical protein
MNRLHPTSLGDDLLGKAERIVWDYDHTSEVADIVAEEKACDEFLRKQQASRRSFSQQNHSAQRSKEEI